MRKVWGTAMLVWSCYCVALACFFGLLASARVAEQFAEPGTLNWGYALMTVMAAVVALTFGLSRLLEYVAVRWVFPRLFEKSQNVTCHESADDERRQFESWLMADQMLTPTWNEQRNCYEEFAAHLAYRAWRAAPIVRVMKQQNVTCHEGGNGHVGR